MPSRPEWLIVSDCNVLVWARLWTVAISGQLREATWPMPTCHCGPLCEALGVYQTRLDLPFDDLGAMAASIFLRLTSMARPCNAFSGEVLSSMP